MQGLSKLRVLLLLLSATPLLAQANAGDEAWTKTAVQQDASGTVNPSRVTETYSKKGSRTTSKRALESVGPDGKFAPYSDTENETVQVDANTTRSTQRSYSRDANGNRTLVQVTEERTRKASDGSQETTRITSNPDLNGRLQIVQKEVRQVKAISPSVQESTSTVMLRDANGNVSPSMRVQQRETRTGQHSLEFRKSTLLPDVNGNWQTAEVREGTTKDTPQGSTTEERVLQPGSDGKLALVGKTVTHDSKGPNDTRSTTETYSNSVPGMTSDDGLHLVEKATTVRSNDASGQQRTVQSVQRPSAGNPADGLQTTQRVIDIVRPGGSSTQEQVTTLSRDANGNMNVVQVDTGRQVTAKPAQGSNPAAAKRTVKANEKTPEK